MSLIDNLYESTMSRKKQHPKGPNITDSIYKNLKLLNVFIFKGQKYY